MKLKIKKLMAKKKKDRKYEEKKSLSLSLYGKHKVSDTLTWRLVRGNVLGFLGMFKDSHIWLQITPGN